MHKSQLFFCPGQSYGISWNVCAGRQAAHYDKCDVCPYKEWQSKGLPGFNPYVGAFDDGTSRRSCGESRTTPDPRYDRVFKGEMKHFLPEDIGLAPKSEKPRSIFKVLYSLI